VYIGYVVCINHDKYIREAEDDEKLISGYDYELTDYAREHVDECCLIFDWESVLGDGDDGGFYGQCYLSKDISVDNRVEHHFNPNFEYNEDEKAVAEEIKKYRKIFEEEEKIKKEMYEQDACSTFSKALTYHMKRKNVTVEQLAANSKLSETTIKKYRKGSKPGLENLMAIFIGLNLSEIWCDQLLDLCGYSVNEKGSILEHKVYRELIRNYSDGNIDQWNTILKGFGLDKIPDQRNQKNFT
jgi:transcriptional regulator with XRE-family HTH domain